MQDNLDILSKKNNNDDATIHLNVKPQGLEIREMHQDQ